MTHTPHLFPSSPSHTAAIARAMTAPRWLLQGSVALLVLVAFAHHANAADGLPPLPPLPGMEEPAAPAASAAAAASKTAASASPALKEMPSLPQVEVPAVPAAAQAPSLKQAGLGAPAISQGLPDLPPLPPVSTKDDIARAVANNPSAHAETTLPDVRNVGPSEIDSWLRNKNEKPEQAAALPAPKLPSDIPDTEAKSVEGKVTAVAKEEKSAKDEEKPVAEAKPKKKSQSAKKAAKSPFYSFQYKSQFLPDAIYRPNYTSENKHLPKARYEQEYDRYLFQAAARNDAAGLRALLNTPGRTAEILDPSGQSPLMVAVRYGATQATQTLLSYGANADHRDNSGVSVLHYAVLSHNANLVQALLAARANPNTRDPWGQTPLDIAAYARDAASMHLLQNAMQPQQATLGQPRS